MQVQVQRTELHTDALGTGGCCEYLPVTPCLFTMPEAADIKPRPSPLLVTHILVRSSCDTAQCSCQVKDVQLTSKGYVAEMATKPLALPATSPCRIGCSRRLRLLLFSSASRALPYLDPRRNQTVVNHAQPVTHVRNDRPVIGTLRSTSAVFPRTRPIPTQREQQQPLR